MSATLADELITLKVPERKYNKGNSVTFKLRTEPADANSPTLEVTLPILKGGEKLHDIIQLRREIDNVYEGMAANNGIRKVAIVHQVTRDQARGYFDVHVMTTMILARSIRGATTVRSRFYKCCRPSTN